MTFRERLAFVLIWTGIVVAGVALMTLGRVAYWSMMGHPPPYTLWQLFGPGIK